MSDNTPNFDAMTPEEIMAWMESLAKRQGASEGFTTSADVDVPEIDPSSVVIDEPGYVPPETSKSAKLGGKLPISVPAPKPSVIPKPIERKPEPAAPVIPAAAKSVEPPPKPVERKPAAAELPLFEQLKAIEPPPAAPKTEVASLSWLESLAADQSGGMPELDLSSLAADLTPVASSSPPTTNPIDWLESLAQGQGAEIPAAAEPTDPMDWLESLARRQGVRDEELTTSAAMDVPLSSESQIDGPGYTDYAFDIPTSKPAEPTSSKTMPAPFVASPEPEVVQDPVAWLDALASASSAKRTIEPQGMSDAEIQAALKRGELVPQDQMEAWMNRQLEIGAQRPDPVMTQEDAPAVKAELPDWLLDQVGQPIIEELPPVAPSETPALIDAILEPPPIATSEIPDWLREDEPAAGELDSIFAATDTPPQESWSETRGFVPEVQVETPAAVIHQGDPWFEAFEQEYQEKRGSLEITPTAVVPAARQESPFEPETELPAGVLEDVPDWLAGMIGDEAEAIPAEDIPDWLKQDIGGVLPVEPEPEPVQVSADMPDWLADANIGADEIPDWLTQSITGEQVTVVTPVPAAAIIPAPTPAPVVPVRASPAPVPAQIAAIDIPGTLNRARSFATGNDLDNGLSNYEQLIRANAELDTVVADLTVLAEKIKTSAPILRVLGDGLMRQGKLQAALDTYRKALYQL